MALTLPIETTESLDPQELQEYIEAVARTEAASDDVDLLAEAAVLLKKLANNRRFLLDHVNASLVKESSDSDNIVGDTSFCLARKGPICARANVWVPPSDVASSLRWQSNIAAYTTPHDHPFSFVTVGYLGPGYETTIFEYDRTRIAGQVGERVALQFLEKTTLTEGKVMLYRACKDVHYQAHPEKLSISLNFIMFPRENRDQYGFDVKTSRISFSATDYRRAQSLLCKMAAVLGDGKTSNILEKVARRSEDEAVRLSAFAAWSSLERTRANDIWAVALTDPDEGVRLRARTELQAVA